MYFNWRGFLRDSLHALFPGDNPHLRHTGHRARVLCMYFLCMAWMGGSGRIGLFVDRILFPRSLRAPVTKPVFIVGNFRSGSTLLHRLLASDPQFTAMKTWEIYFAPSVTMRRFWRGFWIVDGWFGGTIRRRIKKAEASTLGDVKMHRVVLGEPEEDEALLLYLWESLFNWFFMPYQADRNPYWRFDEAIPRWRRKTIMRFYHTCIRRHVYAHRASRLIYISKNPSFSAKLRSLLNEFPDARIVYLVRHPADTLVSTIGWFSYAWNYFASPTERYPFRSTIMELTRRWYLEPARVLQTLPPSQYRVVRYEDLVRSPFRTVTRLMEHFGLKAGVQTHQQLNDLENGPPVHRSHSVELEHVGLDPGMVAGYYAEVYEQYGYGE